MRLKSYLKRFKEVLLLSEILDLAVLWLHYFRVVLLNLRIVFGQDIGGAKLLHPSLECLTKFDWVEKLHQIVKLFNVVLKGGSRQKHFELSMDRHRLLEEASVTVLHLLTFVNDYCLPIYGSENIEVGS